MAECKTCIHQRACEAWIRNGTTLYDDFTYSVEKCPYYMATLEIFDQMLNAINRNHGMGGD